MIQRRIVDRFGDVQESEGRHAFEVLDGFSLAVDVTSKSTLLDVGGDAQNVSRTRMSERDEIRDPVVRTRLSPNGLIVVVVGVVVARTRLSEDRFFLGLVV